MAALAMKLALAFLLLLVATAAAQWGNTKADSVKFFSLRNIVEFFPMIRLIFNSQALNEFR